MLKNTKNYKPYDYYEANTFYLCVIIITLVVQALCSFVAVGLSGKFPDIAESGDFNTAFMIIIQLVNFAVVYGYSRLKRRSFDFTLIKRENDCKGVTPLDIIVPIVLAVLLMVGMYLPTIWYGKLMVVIGVPSDYGEITIDTTSAVVMLVIASVFLAPAFEELIYRGVLLHGLKREKSVIASVLISALAFMLMHMNPLQVVFQFTLGVISGFIALRSGKLLPSVILHSASNVLALIVEFTPLSANIGSCVSWLCNNPVAAVFITIGLLAAASAATFFIIKYGFRTVNSNGEERVKSSATENTNGVSTGSNDKIENGKGADNCSSIVEKTQIQVREDIMRRDGTFRRRIALVLCAVMLVVNLITAIVS